MQRAARDGRPLSFSSVMATGILSIDAAERGIPALAAALLVIAISAYLALISLAGMRSLGRPRIAPDRWRRSEFRPLTFVAATAVLGTRLVTGGASGIAIGLLAVGLVSWIAISCRLGASLAGRERLDPQSLLTGSTFLTVVAVQSLATLCVALAVRWQSEPLAFVAVCLWLAGASFYPVLVTLLAARLIFLPFPARAPRPDSWIVMGALAITTLAGGELAAAGGIGAWMSALRPFIVGLTVAAWAGASLLIAPLLALELRGALRARPRLTYDPERWATVFPLARYAVASSSLARIGGPPALAGVGAIFFAVALGAWATVAAAGALASAGRIDTARGVARRGEEGLGQWRWILAPSCDQHRRSRRRRQRQEDDARAVEASHRTRER